MPRKTADPVEIKLLDAMTKAHSAWERGWRRMKRAMHAMEKADRIVRRLEMSAGRPPGEGQGSEVNPTFYATPAMPCSAPAKSFPNAPAAHEHARKAADAFRVVWTVFRILAGRPRDWRPYSRPSPHRSATRVHVPVSPVQQLRPSGRFRQRPGGHDRRRERPAPRAAGPGGAGRLAARHRTTRRRGGPRPARNGKREKAS